MALNDFRQNFASRPLFTGELGRDLVELERRAGSAIHPANHSASVRRSQSNNTYQQAQPSSAGNFGMLMNSYNGGGATGQFGSLSGRTPLAEHHHLGGTMNSNVSGPGNYSSQRQQVSFVSAPNAPLAPASLMSNSQYGNINGGGVDPQPKQYYSNSKTVNPHVTPATSQFVSNQPTSNSSYVTVAGGDGGGIMNNDYGAGGGFSPGSSSRPMHGVRGPSQSGAWSLLPPQIPRPLGLQRFLDKQFAPPEMERQNGPSAMSPQVENPDFDSMGRRSSTGHGRSSGATRAKSTPSKQVPLHQSRKGEAANKRKRTPTTNAAALVGDYGLGRGPYALNSSDADDGDFDPIATGARARRQQVDNEIAVHSGGLGVSEFAQSLGVGTAEAVAAKMASEVARQAAMKPAVTPEDLQSNNSASTSANQKSAGPRATEVAIMRRRMERIDDGLARATMRQQIAQERLKNVVASGLVAEGGAQTDTSMMPLDTGAKPRSHLLVDPSAVDPESIGGPAAGRGGLNDDEAEMEAAAKMQRMRKAGLLLMPAVPYEHFKYVAPEISSSMMTRREQDERARKNPGEAKGEAKSALESRLDQLQLANEELLVRNRIVPTQPDQFGSNRPGTDRNIDPTSVLAHVDPKEQLMFSPNSARVPNPRIAESTVDHAAMAHRLQHQNIAAPAGGYGSVLDPRSQQQAQALQASEEERRWAVAKARNEAEGMTYSASGGGGGMLGASATAQLRTQQDDSGLLANAALRTLPSGNQRDPYDARKKWAGVSFATPGSKFQGTHMDAISKESRELYGLDHQQQSQQQY